MKNIYLFTITILLFINYSFCQTIPNKVFVLGNSLTQGFGTHGMASTDTNTDYYYWVQQAIFQKNDSISMNRFSGSTWESLTTSKKRLAFLNNSVARQIDGKEDLIIIQLGDNVNTEDKRKNLFEDAKTLLNWFLNKSPNSRILWVYGWYGVSKNMPIIQNAISEVKGCELVDISKYNKKQYQNIVGNTYVNKNGNIETISSNGVASHPGDLGMEMIANEIISKLSLKDSISEHYGSSKFTIELTSNNGNKLNLINFNNKVIIDAKELYDQFLIINILNETDKIIFSGKIKIKNE
ncbi:SGNH/GDSL hydrolase family protein [Confluentibacter sediminis]|uniref:SGNH/GDSL hydrolase family protein n=1 Tax=Confluentibacter sediminis TaxID=2219045 RepID=UPI000DAD5AB5|nr:SGNH/GDSL hydrolase family protein [Confluentibacter sediminis]